MRALCWNGINDLRVETVPDPEILTSHDVILRVTMSTTCGSDLHFIDGYIPTMRSGDIIGHEFMGVVEDVGSQVRRVKKGDRVVVISGRDKGRKGEVLRVMPQEDRALISGVNMVKRHQKQTQAQEGGIISKEAPIHLSNIAYVGKDGKPTRVGFKIPADGKKVRIAKSSGAEIDG